MQGRQRWSGRRVLLVALCVCPVSAAEPDEVIQALVRPGGWRAEWTGPGGSGLTEVTFERRGDGLVARMRLIVPFELACEKPVRIEAYTVTFDGCRDPNVTLVYDASDAAFPLKGRSPRGYEWKVRPK